MPKNWRTKLAALMGVSIDEAVTKALEERLKDILHKLEGKETP